MQLLGFGTALVCLALLDAISDMMHIPADEQHR
jgi:hypothetical protein